MNLIDGGRGFVFPSAFTYCFLVICNLGILRIDPSAGSQLTDVPLGLVDPNAPHEDDDQGITGDEQQIDAKEQVVEDISYVAPLVLQLALLLQRSEVVTKVP